MKTKATLELADLKAIAAAAEKEAIANQWAVTIAIVDDGGHLLWLQRLDGAAPVSAQIAPAKARTAALGRRESRLYEEMINGGRVSFLSAPGLEGLLHISELAEHKVESPEDVVQAGEEIEVRILRVDVGDRKIALSRRRLGTSALRGGTG